MDHVLPPLLILLSWRWVVCEEPGGELSWHWYLRGLDWKLSVDPAYCVAHRL